MKTLSVQLRLFFYLTFYFLTVNVFAQELSDFIVIDQFGYRPEAIKTAVIRNPAEGIDANVSFSPGVTFQVIDESTGNSVFEGSSVVFSGGNTDPASGDKIWWFDFTSVTTPGKYYILDKENSVRSFSFNITDDVYNKVLKHAVRMLFYQRAGYEKTAEFAGVGWADGASHVGNLQDKNCRLYNRKADPATERDLHGGWYDAGDYNKYTAWAASCVEGLLLSFLERPEAFDDNYNIPESGNGIPDILDEAKWGMDWLLRMQNEDGSVLSIVGMSHASPPSSAKGQSVYGPQSTTATMASAKAFAIGSKVYKYIGLEEYANQLKQAAIKAWDWAEQNPNVVFHNNSSTNGSTGVGAGDQEVTGDYNRLAIRLNAAMYLFEITGDQKYLDIFQSNYRKLPLFIWTNYVSQYWTGDQSMFLYFLDLPGAGQTHKTSVANALRIGFNKSGDYAKKIGADGYRSFIADYNWGSNKYKSDYGFTFHLIAEKSLEADKNNLYREAAEEYIHYLHGVNPFNMVYLTNMNDFGASKSATEIFHTWFANGSAKWDKAGVSTYGPAPGYLSGGPNKFYTWDGCCDSKTCGSYSNNALCNSEQIPVNQPPAKMYKDFNTGWPLNSWEITEPSIGYQVSYIRLLSKFVASSSVNSVKRLKKTSVLRVYPNPSNGTFHIQAFDPKNETECFIYDINGQLLFNKKIVDIEEVNLKLPPGLYFIKGVQGFSVQTSKMIVN